SLFLCASSGTVDLRGDPLILMLSMIQGLPPRAAVGHWQAPGFVPVFDHVGHEVPADIQLTMKIHRLRRSTISSSTNCNARYCLRFVEKQMTTSTWSRSSAPSSALRPGRLWVLPVVARSTKTCS